MASIKRKKNQLVSYSVKHHLLGEMTIISLSNSVFQIEHFGFMLAYVLQRGLAKMLASMFNAQTNHEC